MKNIFRNIILLSVLLSILSLQAFKVINESTSMIIVKFNIAVESACAPMYVSVVSGSNFTQAENIDSWINIFNIMTQQWSNYNGIDDASIIKYKG